jgi:FKBP-type peptidyl-prolyl cis-trans isomerase
MRRIAASSLLVPLAAVMVLAGCGSSGPSASGNANAAVTVSGSFAGTPKVTIPHRSPAGSLFYHTMIKGSGAMLASGDSMLAKVTIYKWSGTTSKLLTTGTELIPPSISLPGLVKALKGAAVGSRILAVLPPKYAYGTSGYPGIGVSGHDTLVWVLDLLEQFPPTAAASGTRVSSGGGALPSVSTPKSGQAPVVTIPKKSPPAKLSVTTLVKGNGQKLASGDTVVAQYVGLNWRTGKVFDQSWPTTARPQGATLGFQLGNGVIAGWSQGLQGITVGSRVMLVIPPSLAYGPQGGQASAGIKKNDTLVFVIDVLAARPMTA